MQQTENSTALIVDIARVAQEFGCTERTIQGWVKQGMPKIGHGKYDLCACFRWKIKQLEDEYNEGEGLDPLERERQRLTRNQSVLAEMEIAEKRGLLIPLDKYKHEVMARYTTVRQRILQLPAQIAPKLEGEDRLAIKTKLQLAVRELLEALAQGDIDGSTGTNRSNSAADSLDADAGRTGSDGSGVPDDARSRAGATPGESGTGSRAGATTRPKHKRVGRKNTGAKKGHQQQARPVAH